MLCNIGDSVIFLVQDITVKMTSRPAESVVTDSLVRARDPAAARPPARALCSFSHQVSAVLRRVNLVRPAHSRTSLATSIVSAVCPP